MALLNVTDAADAVGVSRTTFYKHIREKDISFSKDENGHKQFDPAELVRVYGNLQGLNSESEQDSTPVNAEAEQPVQAEMKAENEILRVKLEAAERERDLWKNQAEEAREDYRHLMRVHEKQTALLPAPASNDDQPAQRSFWQWLKG